MFKFNDWSIKSKLIVVGVTLPLLLVGMLLFFYNSASWREMISSSSDKARAITLSAMAVREQMEDKSRKGFYAVEMLQKFVKNCETDKFFMLILIVAAWESARANAKEGRYEFKTPKFDPRNPTNQPDEIEAMVIK